jgi:hypothetical protein
MPRALRERRDGERLVSLFLLGTVLFSPLVVRIFDVGVGREMFGIPGLFFYLFVAWAALIGLTAFVIENAPGKRGILPAAKSVTDKDDGAA